MGYQYNERFKRTSRLSLYARKLEFKKDANMLKGGIVYSDFVTTVSNTYAQEIQTAYYGEGLDGLLSARNQSLLAL